MTHADRMAAIRAREAASTPGDWRAFYAHRSICVGDSRVLECVEDIEKSLHIEMLGGDNIENDAQFIAHARSDIPYLLARNAALEAAMGEAIEAIDYWQRYAPDYDRHLLQGDIDRLTAIKAGTTDAD